MWKAFIHRGMLLLPSKTLMMTMIMMMIIHGFIHALPGSLIAKVGWPLGMETIYTAVLNTEINNKHREIAVNLTVRIPSHMQDP